MASFNLLDEKWIPCVMLDGQPEELGLSDVLINATSVREVLDQSPLVTIALHRLMLAVLHRNFGPSDIAAWKDLWRQGRWNADVLTDYFTECRNGFYLFHPVRPFYQVPRMVEVKELSPVTRLAAQIASGNNPTLFNHSFDGAVEPVPTAQAARWLLAFQGFSLGGGVSKPFNFSDAPLARGYTVLAVGANLFETLMLNLTPYGRSLPQGFRHLDEDLPAWEQKDPAAPERDGTQPNGYLDYLTWQSRRIWLQPEGDSAVVRWCQVQQNLKLAPGKLDQFMRFRKNKDEGYVQVKLEEERAVWRDSHALFQDVSTESLRPEFFNWLARIDRERKYGSITAQERYDLQVIGQGTPPGRANVVFWRHERLPLPLSYLDDKALEAALGGAERQALARASPPAGNGRGIACPGGRADARQECR
ncbi:MAG: type I-E CRISPR-associated protein Cse1/CasA [Chloroflexi bacterium]|nr:type I-E CRISPR-associated protein Cse1/CasA [Chloroflexota bacterium]